MESALRMVASSTRTYGTSELSEETGKYSENMLEPSNQLDRIPHMFTMLSGEAHAERRRMFTSVYSKSNIQRSPEIRDICQSIISGRLRTEIAGWARHGTKIDVLEMNKACMMDLTTAFLFGLGNGANLVQDHEATKQILTAFLESPTATSFFWLTEFPVATKFLRRIGVHLIPEAAERSLLFIQEWCGTMCEAAGKYEIDQSLAKERQSPTTYPVVYAQLRKGLEKSDIPQDRENAIVVSELLDMLFASTEVSGITLMYLMYELSKHPSRQRALKEELCSLLASDPTTPLACRADIDALPLLDAVLMESMRLHSAHPGPWPRRVPAAGCEQIGPFHDIPAGTIISASTWTLHRNADVFPQPEEWLPDRWLDASPESLKEMMRWFWTFGSGARTCIGTHFAIHCMKAVIATIYTEFETKIVDDTGIEHIDGILAGPVGGKLLLDFHQI